MRVLWIIFGVIAVFGTGCDFILERALPANPQSQPTAIPLSVTVLLQADTSLDTATYTTLQTVLAARLNALDIPGEVDDIPTGNRCVVVRLAQPTDENALDTALKTLSQVGLLEFVNMRGMDTQRLTDYKGEPVITTAQIALNLAPAIGTLAPLTRDGEPFETVFTGEIIAQAEPATTNGAIWFVEFAIRAEDQQALGDYTAQNIMQPLGIVLDGRLLTAPVIQARLDSGGVITGNFTEAETQALAAQLLSGALPVPLTLVATTETGDALDTSGCG